MLWRRGLVRLWRRYALVTIAAAATLSCRPQQPPAEAPPKGPTPAVRVQRLAKGPRLARLTRSGDPEAALALAIAFPHASPTRLVLHQGLALLLHAKLKAGGLESRVHADSLGIRLIAQAETTAMAEAWVALLSRTLTSLPSKSEVAKLAPQLEALRNIAVASDAELTNGHCDGSMQVQASQLDALMKPATFHAQLIELLQTLHSRHIALAIVGGAAMQQAVVDASHRADWPLSESTTAPFWPQASQHHIHQEPHADEHRLVATFWRPAAMPPAGKINDWASASEPLVRHLAVDGIWALREVAGTARGYGSCLKFVLTAAPRQTAASAERALRVLRYNVATSSSQASTSRVQALSGDARKAAEVSAWQALAQPAHHPQQIHSVLHLAGPHKDLEKGSPAEPKRSDSDALLSALRPQLEVRTRNESGQSQLRALLANPCTSSTQGSWRHGASLLAAMTAADASTTPAVGFQAFARARALGLVATPNEPGLNPSAQALRLGESLGRAISQFPLDARAFALQHQHALRTHQVDPLLARWLHQMTAAQPEMLLGLPASKALTTLRLTDANQAWRQTLRGPWRLAVLRNGDETQSQRLLAALKRWLPPASAPSIPCKGPLPAYVSGRQRIDGVSARGRILVGFGQPTQNAKATVYAKWVATLLNDRLNKALSLFPSLRFDASSPGFGTVLLQVSVDRGRIDEALGRIEQTLARYRSLGLDESATTNAYAVYRREELNRLASPEERLYELWQHGAVHLPPSSLPASELQRWFNQAAQQTNLVVVAHKGLSAKP